MTTASTTTVVRKAEAKLRASRTAYLFLLPFLIVFAVSIVIPLGYALVISLFKRQLIRRHRLRRSSATTCGRSATRCCTTVCCGCSCSSWCRCR